MESVIFPNDSNTFLLIPKDPGGIWNAYKSRPFHESLFRNITSFMIKEKIIKGNIIDLGAWIGDNSGPWAQIQDGTVYAIDPSEGNCNFIRQVAQLNDLDNLKVIQSAISDKDEIISTNDDLGHASFSQNDSGRNKMTSTSLDNLVSKGEIKDVGYIHLDVEGMEYMILKGSKELINKYRPIIVYEIHLQLDVDKNEAIKELLISSGYKIHLMNEVLPGCRPDCRNVLSIPKEREDEFIIDKIYDYLNNYNYMICLHVSDRYEVLKFQNTKDAHYTFMLLKGGSHACVLINKEQELLNSYGIDAYVKGCYQHAKSIIPRDNYFIELK